MSKKNIYPKITVQTKKIFQNLFCIKKMCTFAPPKKEVCGRIEKEEN